jgi:hypothetical protein
MAGKTVEFTLTTGEFMRFAEALEVILSTHSMLHDVGLVNIKLVSASGSTDADSTLGSPRLEIRITKYDDEALGDTEWLARYVIDDLGMREDLAPLKRLRAAPGGSR